MRPFILTLAALVVLSFVMPACTPAQNTTIKGPEQAIADAQKDAEAAAKEAQKQAGTAARDAQNKVEQAQKGAEAAQLEAATQAVRQREVAKTLIVPSTGAFTSTSPSRATILVIPADQIKPEDLAAITEDISVMCRVFDKKLEEEQGIAPAARPWIGFPFGGTTETEGICLEGYGALFLLKVDMPLIPPPETKKEQPKEEGDPLWEETKRELHSAKEGEGFGGGGGIYGGGAMFYSRGGNHLDEEYNAEKVERLKTTLIKSLKHAANIHSLKPDESVIITVRGCAPAAVVEETVVEHEEHGSETHSKTTGVTRRVPVRTVESTKVASTVLTIRAKKSDIDAFSKGELNFDQFRQKVRILLY